MAGQKFEYDESGTTFLHVVLSFLAVILVPSTYYFWPNAQKKGVIKRQIECYCEPCLQKEQVLKQKEPARKLKRFSIRLALTLGWLLFAFVAYKITLVDYDLVNFDPYEILGVDKSATVREIRKAYHKLSRVYHPDKETGDEALFIKISKAHEALTDDTARENWEKYGNPDGPGAMSMGIALPSWIVEKENSVWVLGLYTLVFMVALPTIVGTWWYKSIQYSSDKVLMDTTSLYYYFFQKASQLAVPRILMILAASFEFEKRHNPEVQERFSDNEEVNRLIRQLPRLNENNKEHPLCRAYSMKARSLLHAHLTRMQLPPETLELDRQFVTKKCTHLLQEMVSIIAELVVHAHAGRVKLLPSLTTIEGTMKLSQMIVQALWETKNPMLQLPHITEDMQKYFMSKKRLIKSVQQFCEMKEEDRRGLLKSLNDDQYEDVLRVCASMPLIDFHIECEVIDDEDAAVVTAGAIVTVTVNITRSSLGDLLKGEAFKKIAEENYDDSESEYLDDDKENIPSNAEEVVTEKPVQAAKPVWLKQRKGGKKAGGGKKKSPTKPVTKPVQSAQRPDPEESEEAEDDDKFDTKEHSDEEDPKTDQEAPQSSPEADDDEWEKCQQKLSKNRERKFQGKSKMSHPVHCPYFPDVKQEYWWVYVCDKKKKRLVSAPYLITNLITSEESQLQFMAPPKPGKFQYTVCLRSDSYFGFDKSIDFKLDVKEAKVIELPAEEELSEKEDEQDSDDHESDFASDDDEE